MNGQPALTRHLKEQQLKRWCWARIDKMALEKNKKALVATLPDVQS